MNDNSRWSALKLLNRLQRAPMIYQRRRELCRLQPAGEIDGHHVPRPSRETYRPTHKDRGWLISKQCESSTPSHRIGARPMPVLPPKGQSLQKAIEAPFPISEYIPSRRHSCTLSRSFRHAYERRESHLYFPISLLFLSQPPSSWPMVSFEPLTGELYLMVARNTPKCELVTKEEREEL